MPSSTAHGYPYPVGSDSLGDTDVHIKNLADKIEAQLKRIESGSVAQACTAGTNHTVVVNFAAAFAAAPIVVASPNGTDADAVSVLVNAVSTTQATFIIKSAAAATRTIRWIAHG